MRFQRLVTFCFVSALATATSFAQAPAAVDAAPTPEQLRRALSDLPRGRLQRPASFDSLTPEQRDYVEGILSGPRNGISGPLVVMLASPGLGDLAQRTMAYARFAGTEGYSNVAPKLNELAVIMAAREWSSPYVWNAHHRYAVRMGLPAELVESVRTGAPPPADLEADVAAVYELLDELSTNRQVGDATFRAARAALGGERELVDLIGTFAIYQMSAMLTAVDRTGLADGETPTLNPLE